ncbi:MAG TPA: holo-ACP synthase [Thermoleophilia bacterium]
MAALLGVGADILLIERIRHCLDSPSFMRRTFTEAETQTGESRPDPGSYYAKVFAGKEAVFKCFGIMADSLGSWRDIEIIDSDDRQPVVNLSGSLAIMANSRGIKQVLLSLSYDTDYAMAVAALNGGVSNDG